MKGKRFPTLLLIGLLVGLFTLAACQSPPPEEPEDTASVTEDESAAEAEDSASDDAEMADNSADDSDEEMADGSADDSAEEPSDDEAAMTDEGEVSAESGDLIYPFQYPTVADYEADTGSSIASFQESPLLTDMVESGDLPPIEERLPSEPLVVQPLAGVGEYGGELAGPSTSPNCCGWDVLEMRLQKLVTIDTDLRTIVPNIAKDFEISEDQTTFTFYLREGHKWSDGEPFTAEDFRFWFEDVISNEELTAAPPALFAPNGELATFEIIDDTTVRYTFAEPHPGFILSVAEEVYNRGFRPAHYFKQFHPDYNEDLDALVEEEGFDDWIQLFNAKMQPYNFTWDMGADNDPGAPTLNTFVYEGNDSFGNKQYTRNPYFFKVDIAGNQLPYTDSLRRILVEDLQVQDLKALAGEYSHFGWGSLLNVPTYRDSEEAGGYRTALTRYDRGNEYTIGFNMNHPDPVMREIFNDIRFRQAMSVAIDRNEINELVYFGLAKPSQTAPTETSMFYEPWMAEYFAQYDPDLANQLLDEMGLDQRDEEGYRLRPDGETLFINYQIYSPEEAWENIGELVVDYWNAVGVKTNFKLIENGLYEQLRQEGTLDLTAWALDLTDMGDYANGFDNMTAGWGIRENANAWEDYVTTDGKEGEEPPAEVLELSELAEDLGRLPFASDEYIEIGAELYKKSFEGLYQIGTIQAPPQPLLFDINLCNTPPNDTEGVWSWTYRQWVLYMPEQWYFSSDGC